MPLELPGFITRVFPEMAFSSGFMHFEVSFSTRLKVVQFSKPQLAFSPALWSYHMTD